MKIKILMLTMVLSSSFSSYGFVKKLDEIPKEDKEMLEQVKIEKGGLVMLEQYLEKKEKYNHKDAYTLKFLCPKTSKGKLADCRIIKYEVLDKTLR